MVGAVLADRALMGFSLGVHIILAVIGIALPLIILLSEIMYARTKDKAYRALSKRLSTVLVILFAVGTASGTLVALELAVLWPKFMALVGQVAILPFYVEAFAFFGEAIFLSAFLYSYHRNMDNSRARMLFMAIVAVCAALSGALITMVNAFMNTPAGFDIQQYLLNGTITDVHPLAAFNTPSTGIEVLHVLSTSYMVGAFLFLAYVCYRLLKENDALRREYYRKAARLIFWVVLIATVIAVYSGIQSIASMYYLQPEKFAAIEGDMIAQAYAPEYLGGIPVNGTLKYYIAIPGLQSILATGSPSGTVPGLEQYPQSTWPPLIVHTMFDPLVGSGFAIGALLALVLLMMVLKRRPFESRLLLYLMIIAGMLSLFLLEDGWAMAEIGRQPWIIYNVMSVSDAANASPQVIPIAAALMLFYAVIMPFTLLVLRRIFDGRQLEADMR
ncbi:MAG: cytochrome ubiquinol oxidase subunit I [Candidatus Micrarchaeota archaeon]|nr:cytochrome ubiquinol oxidase subunit I [Candidatus Micrarchaeota archaeon]